MPLNPDQLLERLEALGITTETIHHPPLFTVADAQALRGQIAGAQTKNLFVRDKKGNFFLITADEDAEIDLKSLHREIGASGRLSFGRPEQLMELLGVVPGSVTLFGAVNDTEGRVRVIIDGALMEHEIFNAHPLTNEATTSIKRDDMMRFLEATGHIPSILKVAS
jgi:Ala-tRNA(Pro) deacylase